MSALLGTVATWAALAFALALMFMGFFGLARAERASAAALRVPAVGLFVSASLAMLALEIGLLSNDFSVEYIANNSAATTPFIYKVASAWAALEGSLVLWGLVLALFTFLIWMAMRRLDGPDPLWAGALGVMGAITAFFYFMMAWPSNPFEVCTQAGVAGCAAGSIWPFAESQAPLAGLGPNPLLQNHPLMAAHPPLLYIGYVGMAAPFSFAMSSLIIGESGDRWLRVTRNWTRIAWVFLTIGIVLGGLWSYEVLGWGGYWAWDPVENASFMPWLVATMFIHTAALQMRRGVLQAWSYGLVVATFSLTIFGTFLTRSGVINSVHAFQQSVIGQALLLFLIAILVGAFGVYAARIQRVGSAPRLDSLQSREGMFMVNNLLLGVFAFVVLVGTVYPIFVEWITGDQVGVGRPFFDRMALPLSFALLAAMAIGPVTPYRKASLRVVWERIRSPLRAALAVSAASVVLWRPVGWLLLTVLLSTFVVGTILRQLWTQSASAARKRGTRVPAEMLRLSRRDSAFWGGQIAHIGIAVLALGIALSSNQSITGTIDLKRNRPVEFAGFQLTLVDDFVRDEPQRIVTGARVEIRRGEEIITVLEPRLNQYVIRIGNEISPRQQIATPAVDTGIRGDLYLSLGSDPAQTPVELDLYWFPFIWVVWVGGFLAGAGGLWAWLVKPARRREDATEEPARV